MIIKKSAAEIELIREAGAVLAECLRLLTDEAKAGLTTLELDAMAERFILESGCAPAFKGYKGYPATICASPNEVVVHGIPDGRKLVDGDILSIDVGVARKDYIADAAVTVGIGRVSGEAARLMSATKTSLEAGIEACRPGNRIGDISSAVQAVCEEAGFSVVRALVGHGVGRHVHEDPQIPNYGPAGKGPLIETGMVFAIEPMVNAGDFRVSHEKGWPVATADGSISAHFEHTVAVTPEGAEILTIMPESMD